MTSPSTDALFSVSGRTIVVTGAGRGLGRGIALALAGAGARVVGVARGRDQLEQAATDVRPETGGTLLPLPWDVAEEDARDRLLDAVEERAGLPAGIIHAAGIQVRKPAAEFSVAEWRRVQQVNLEAPFFLSRELAGRQARAETAGSHVLVTSLTSHLGVRGTVAYGASKSGLLGVLRGLAAEYAASGIRVNGLGPGYFHTDLTEDLLSEPEGRARVLSRIPMGRLGVPADLAGAVVFLLSDASAYVTGQIINVDGGWLAT